MSSKTVYDKTVSGPFGECRITVTDNDDGTFSVTVKRGGKVIAGAVRGTERAATVVAKAYGRDVACGDL